MVTSPLCGDCLRNCRNGHCKNKRGKKHRKYEWNGTKWCLSTHLCAFVCSYRGGSGKIPYIFAAWEQGLLLTTCRHPRSMTMALVAPSSPHAVGYTAMIPSCPMVSHKCPSVPPPFSNINWKHHWCSFPAVSQHPSCVHYYLLFKAVPVFNSLNISGIWFPWKRLCSATLLNCEIATSFSVGTNTTHSYSQVV